MGDRISVFVFFSLEKSEEQEGRAAEGGKAGGASPQWEAGLGAEGGAGAGPEGSKRVVLQEPPCLRQGRGGGAREQRGRGGGVVEMGVRAGEVRMGHARCKVRWAFFPAFSGQARSGERRLERRTRGEIWCVEWTEEIWTSRTLG